MEQATSQCPQPTQRSQRAEIYATPSGYSSFSKPQPSWLWFGCPPGASFITDTSFASCTRRSCSEGPDDQSSTNPGLSRASLLIITSITNGVSPDKPA